MENTYKKFINLYIILFSVSILGCEKLIEIKTPINETPSAAVFASDKSALGALSGMYAGLAQSSFQLTGLSVNTSLMSDDLNYLSLVPAIQEFANNTYTANTASGEPFTNYYSVIYRANSIILGLQTTTGTSERIKKQLTAEAKLMRAYCYFNLVNLYGGVPLVLTTDPNISAFQGRESVDIIYQQMVADLSEAKSDLLTDYTFSSGSRIGVNKFTATALLARVYLFMGNYVAAETNASEVIASNLYSLIPSDVMATNLFVRNSQESIWQLPPYIVATGQYTAEGAAFIPANNTISAIGYQIQPNLLQIFPAGDLRRTRWMSDLRIGTSSYTIPFKYKYRQNTGNIFEYQIILRLAEQFLIRAESRARQGSNISGALSDLNTIRARAGLSPISANNPNNLLDEIALENRREFFCEQAFRWYNLKRIGQVDIVIGALKPTYKPTAKFYPFAQSIINVNSNITQNAGY